MKATRSLLLSIIALVALNGACTHQLAVKNLDLYSMPTRLEGTEQRITVAVLPFSGRPDETYYFNALLDRIRLSPSVVEVRTDYVAGKSANSFRPDVILSIQPQIVYRSSGWNFLINWPGFLIFTPAWNGYVYHADIVTQVGIHDSRGNLISQEQIPVSYSIRHAEMDRTIWTGLTWLEVSALALTGGIYNAFVFDDDILPQLQVQVRENYATYVGNAVRPKVIAAAGRSQRRHIAEGGTWVNPTINATDRDHKALFSKAKVECIERAYVGQTTLSDSQGNSTGRITGSTYGYVNQYSGHASGRVNGDQRSSFRDAYRSEPAFNEELFEACMGAAGWELR